jgi:hypothetical protein
LGGSVEKLDPEYIRQWARKMGLDDLRDAMLNRVAVVE